MPKRSNTPNRLTGLLYCADCGAKLTRHKSLVQGKYIDDVFTCSRYRGVQDCTIHYIPTQKLETAKDCQKQIVRAKKRYAELNGLVKKLYEANATGKLPDKHFSRLFSEYDEEQTSLEVSITEWQEQLDNWNTERVNNDRVY